MKQFSNYDENKEDFKIPNEWRSDFIKAYAPLVTGKEFNGLYEKKIDDLSAEEVYKVLYFCEVSTKLEWKKGLEIFDESRRRLALRYIKNRGRFVPILKIPEKKRSLKHHNYKSIINNILISILTIFLLINIKKQLLIFVCLICLLTIAFIYIRNIRKS